MGAFIKRHVVAAVAATVVLAGGVGVAIAVAQGSDSTGPGEPEPGSIAEPRLIPFEEQETFRPGVPDDPYIDFCPTPEQVEAFAERSGGLDLKPRPPGRMGCSSRGAWTPPDPPYPDPPEEQMTEEEICEQEREWLLEARPVPSDNPLEFRGAKPDGGEIVVYIDGDADYLQSEGINDIHDLAEQGSC